MFIYREDVQGTGPSAEKFWNAICYVGSFMNWLGVQETPRKHCKSSTKPGPWAGSFVNTSQHSVFLSVGIIGRAEPAVMQWILYEVENGELIDRKILESHHRCLVYWS